MKLNQINFLKIVTFFITISILICNCNIIFDVTTKSNSHSFHCDKMTPQNSSDHSNLKYCDTCPLQKEKFNTFENLVVQTNFYFYELIPLSLSLQTISYFSNLHVKAPPPLDKIKFNC